METDHTIHLCAAPAELQNRRAAEAIADRGDARGVEGVHRRIVAGAPAGFEIAAAPDADITDRHVIDVGGHGEVGVGDGLNNLPLPFFKNYFAGGVSSVRGYKTSSLGPKDADGNPQGGSHKLLGNAEFLFPFPGLTNDRSVRLGAFLDAGMIANSFDMNEFRYSTGMSLFWSSPMGPLKISFAAPLNAEPSDRKQIFQFSFGGTF